MLSDEKLVLRAKLWALLDIPQRYRGGRIEEKLLELGITKREYHIWKQDWKAFTESERVRRTVIAREKMNTEMMLANPDLVEKYRKANGSWTVDDRMESDPEAWLNAQKMFLYKSIKESAGKGNAQSQKLLSQLGGWLVEKQEVTVGLSADEIARRNSEARAELGDFRNRLGQGMG